MDDNEEYQEIIVPTDTWTVIPHADFQVMHSMGRNCRVRVWFKTQTIEFLDGGKWSVKKYRDPAATPQVISYGL